MEGDRRRHRPGPGLTALDRRRVRPALVAAAFALLLAIYEAIVHGIDYLAYFDRIVFVSRGFDQLYRVPVVAAVVLVSWAWAWGYVWASLVAGRAARVAYFLLFGAVVALQYGYLATARDFARFYDLATIVETGPAIWAGAIRQFWSWTPLAPIAGYAALLAAAPIPARPRQVAPALALGAGAFSFYSALFPFSSGSFPAPAIALFAKTVTYYVWTTDRIYDGPREPIAYRASAAPTRNVLLIVDESVRPDHLGVNGYGRQTTPTLDALAASGQLVSWGIAAAGATMSIPANALLFTGVTELPDRTCRTRRQPALFQYAKAMSYRTALFDGQTENRWFVTRDDYTYIDERIDISRTGYHVDSDFALARLAAGRLTAARGLFAVVLKKGLHFPYNDAFVAGEAVWRPLMGPGPYDPAEPARIVNSYDNGIRYNVDGFFRHLLADPALLETTVVLYTADHGQTLSDHGEPWTHTNHTRNEAAVPLLLVAAELPAVDTGYRASHANVLPTLLDLMAYPEDARRYAYAPSLLRATARDSVDRHYIVGDLFASGHGRFNLTSPGRYDVMNFDAPQPHRRSWRAWWR